MQKPLPTVTLLDGVSNGFINDQRLESWELLQEGGLINGTPVLELVSFLKPWEQFTNGRNLLRRAQEMGGCTSQYHAERLLQQKDTIPPEWRPFYLAFPDTVWRYADQLHKDGRRYVPCLAWCGSEWVLYFRLLVHGGWLSYGRLVRIHSPS